MDPFTATIIVIVIVVIAVGVLAMNVLRAIRSVRRAAGSEAARVVGKMAEELLSGDAGTLSSDLLICICTKACQGFSRPESEAIDFFC